MNWYVVQTKANSEMLALSHLKRQGFTVWLPKYSRFIKHARRTKEVLRPLFPGYIFVKFDPNDTRWRAINGTVGVVRLISMSSHPSTVDAHFMDNLKAAENEQGIIELNEPELRPGDAVEFCSGPLTGVVAKLVRLDAANRVTVLLELLGNMVHGQVARKDIMPV